MRVEHSFEPAPSAFREFCEARFFHLAAIVLTLALFNLTFRLNREAVTEWDEALYATTAAEAVAGGSWIATTLDGQLDYYNTKPPLNIWLIALSFKTFGTSLPSLRLPSVVAAWLTILVLVLWSRRSLGAATALIAGVVLSTAFGFLYVHSGRSANTDALFTLLMLLVAVTLWGANDRRWVLVWLGPIAAAVFLLRGMAVLMPVAFVALALAADWRRLRSRIAPLAVASALAAVPIGAWVAARWQVDRWLFIDQMVRRDFIARSISPLDGHEGTPFYYLYVLQKDQYDWLLAAAAALLLFPLSRRDVRETVSAAQGDRYLAIVGGAFIAVTLVVPTMMRTKVAWYLNPFFPVFAVLIAAAIARGLSRGGDDVRRRRRVLAGLVVLAFVVAETKLIHYSFRRRDVRHHAQGLLLDATSTLTGRRVFRERWPRSCRFVLERVVGGVAQEGDVREFVEKGRPGDYLLAPRRHTRKARIPCVASNRSFALCRYPE